MMFHDTYRVVSGDNLTKIAREFGLSNPGPIVAYPPNATRFTGKSPDLIFPNETILVPWSPVTLKDYIESCEHLITDVRNEANRLLREQMHHRRELQEFLSLVDCLNFIATVKVGIGALAVKGAKGVEMSSKAMLKWFVQDRALMGTQFADIVIPGPTMPQKDFRFYARHALGPWNPSFWASVVIAIKEQDIDIYLYGSSAVEHKNALKIKTQAEADILKAREMARKANEQLSQPFYNGRI